MTLIPKLTYFQMAYTRYAISLWKSPVYVYRNKIFKNRMWVTAGGVYDGPERARDEFKLAFIIKPKNKQ